MANNPNQDQYSEENEMAGEPVSRGASNKSAPMNDESPGTSRVDSDKDRQKEPYNKLIRSKPSTTTQGDGMATNQNVGSPGGGSLPSGGPMGSGNPPGGMNTSNSTAGAGGSSAGAVAGAGSYTDRGKMADTDMDATTNTEDELAKESRTDTGKDRG